MLKFWDKKTGLTLPDGITRTPEEIMANPNWAFTKTAPTILEMAGEITTAIENLHILKSVYNIPDGLSDEDALAAIAAAMEEARNPKPAPDESERLDDIESALIELVGLIGGE